MKLFLILLLLSFYSCNGSSNYRKNILPINYNDKNWVLNNPTLYLGTSFGEYFQILLRTGQYKNMLTLISIKDRKNYGDKLLLSQFKNFNFAYPLVLKAYQLEDRVYWLIYETEINATRTTIEFPVVIENDSCRFLISKFHHPN